MNPLTEFFGRYADFDGRTSRRDCWTTVGAMGLLTILSIAVAEAAAGGSNDRSGAMAGGIVLATVLPWLALAVRRLHDTGRTGWWQLLQVTGVGSIVLLIFQLQRGQAGLNRFGPDPLLSVSGQDPNHQGQPPFPQSGPSTYGQGGPPGRPPKRNRTGLIIGAVVVAVLVIGGLASLASKGSSGARSSQPAAPAPLNSAIQAGDIQVTITSVGQASVVGGEFTRATAADGGILVVVNYSMKNTSSKPVGVFSMPNITIRDPNGTVYKPDAGKTSAYASVANLTAKALSDLNPGLSVTDAEVFEVSKASFDPAKWVVLVDNDTAVAMVQAGQQSAAGGQPSSATPAASPATTTETSSFAPDQGSNTTQSSPAEMKTTTETASGGGGDGPEYKACLSTGDAAQGSDAAMADCTQAEIKRQDAKLNAAYRNDMAQASDDQKEKLRTAERNWISARDSHCAEGNDTGGTIDAVNRSGCILEETQKRAAFLQQPLSTILGQ